MFSFAKQQYLRAGHPWSDKLDLAARDVLQGALRGLGPPKQSVGSPLDRAVDLPGGWGLWVAGGP
eukprot:716611-Lingulodinium_polyedra.AAC.1